MLLDTVLLQARSFFFELFRGIRLLDTSCFLRHVVPYVNLFT